MNTTGTFDLEQVFGGLGIWQVSLDCSNHNPRVRFPKPWSPKLAPVKLWRHCYLAEGKVGYVPSEIWDDVRPWLQKRFEKANPNKKFKEWVEEPAVDLEPEQASGGIRLKASREFLAWAKIPIQTGTKLWLYREGFCIVLTLTPKNNQPSGVFPHNPR